ncbi:hypothetical protein DM558_07040 [Entomomonas moraniae]|uniref:Uncharacterized protein n=1 Tax=Entomomonas moraniae TaxID=2213226 RepID=A0A3S9XE30_9GAMM|nr:pyridoxamine 5'-phosphate oxidase family protein [Entomomonas moraniae]AZS50548.1 hypothetical protein DM558_07040 [Entomomonas moraniae]
MEKVVMLYASKQYVCKEINKLHESTLSLILSTTNLERELETSYTPYIYHKNAYYFLISELAPHTKNIQINPVFSLLLIEDEACAKNIYARNRLVYKAIASKLDKSDQDYQEILDMLRQRAGKTVELLKIMPDFQLFKATPEQGRLIIGFGKAFLLDANTGQVTQVDRDLLGK